MKLHAMKKGIALMLITVLVFSTSVSSASADTKYKVTRVDKESKTEFGTVGTLTDSTTLNITMKSWWYSKSKVKTSGVSKLEFDKGKTSYTCEVQYHKIILTMSGIAFSATISSSPSVSAKTKGNKVTYTCTDAYWSYVLNTSANCWTGSYTQESQVEYKIKAGTAYKGTVTLSTEIEW
ncbi:MAG: hypothetical protein Q4C48_08670 [Lachnospiraceae bacterium]|nr:hypothetical protein [Lachnospiraceae bacterium]